MTVIHGRLARLVRSLRTARETPLVIVEKLLAAIPGRPVELTCFYLMRYESIPAEPRDGWGLELRAATPDDAPALAAVGQSPVYVILARLRAGDVCGLALLDERIVGYQWFCFRSLYRSELTGIEISVAADAVWAYAAYVAPDCRRVGIWRKIVAGFLAPRMRQLGRRAIAARVDHSNRVSIRAHLRFGFQITAEVFVLRVGRRWKSFRRNIRPGSYIPGWAAAPETSAAQPSFEPAATSPKS